jgi:formylglycine-generating enzyme required for sulfatase activity
VEQPQHNIQLNAFEIAKHPVTNAEYFAFIYNAGFRVPRSWEGFKYFEGSAENPVTDISQKDALEYVKWLNSETNDHYRLPTEAEWERAARGNDDRMYCWGNTFDPWRCNTLESAKKGTTPVGSYSPGGDSPFGVSDMLGNVFEWTSSKLQPYPYKSDDGREIPSVGAKIVVKGGSWYYTRKLARCPVREGVLADNISPAIGFRLARNR